MAIDRQRIVDNFYPQDQRWPAQFMPSSIFGYSDGLQWYDYNPDMAKQILQEEGVYDANGRFATTITYRDVVRSYLPQPGWSPKTSRPNSPPSTSDAQIVVMESGAFLDAADAG